MKIVYDASDPWPQYLKCLNELIKDNCAKQLCEIGGGAFPSLSLEQIKEQNLRYTILDISRTELERAPEEYVKVEADICDPKLKSEEKYDLIFSKMLAEHVIDAEVFHTNVYKLLKPGGIAFHFFPTLYSLPFVINRLIPEFLAKLLFNLFVRNDPIVHKRFTAHYNWCQGPIKKQINNLEKVGFEIIEYKGFFGHKYYKKIPILKSLHKLTTRFLMCYPNAYLTSFSFVVLRKRPNPVVKSRLRIMSRGPGPV
ncbi:MAG: class I SAM-dependent methyltransferase [Candidatus Omnitrophica bacterium]|nr:class I SAM-dependent methyltransferase [Candidatus Omnitrophota bacterium]